ncbi:MAG: UDP-N-acetylglucosamine--N-acetylmuramyl-(pentapeptide) pyrophosphoryl-undecaprenol N-acetylglucosamine transferase, partial [Oscillospiraceae bacterium]
MRAVIAAGGTAGHINPALAIAQEIVKNEPQSKIIFIGREDGMEKRLVDQAGFELYPIEIHGFSRSFKPKEIIFNIKSVYCALKGSIIAGKLYREFKPDIVIGCGGYVSGPVVRKAAKMGIKTAIHEQNSFPGVTTKLLSKCADIIFAPNEDAAKLIGKPQKTYICGNPVREALFTANRESLRREWGISDKLCVVSFGGSLGARAINRICAQLMRSELDSGIRFHHIHATGQYGTELFSQLMGEMHIDKSNPDIEVYEYIKNMPECLAVADLVISRSGA